MNGKIKENKLKVAWKRANGVSEEEVKRRLDRAFDILFSEVDKKRNNGE